MSHVFISYVREDQSSIDRLARDLQRRGVEVWLDREEVRPGERWRTSIRVAIEEGAFFIACFSAASEARGRSYMNEELTIAIEELRLRPRNRAWFIPVLLGGSPVPPREIGAGETLRDLQWVDLVENWDVGVARIADASGNDARSKPSVQAPSFAKGVAVGASRAAIPASAEEKLEALRAAVLNTARPDPPDASLQQMFISFLADFTPWHLRILKLFSDPVAWERLHGHQFPRMSHNHLSADGFCEVLESAFPELVGRRPFYDQLWSSLLQRGLAISKPMAASATPSGVLLAKRTTELGDAFLSYISESSHE